MVAFWFLNTRRTEYWLTTRAARGTARELRGMHVAGHVVEVEERKGYCHEQSRDEIYGQTGCVCSATRWSYRSQSLLSNLRVCRFGAICIGIWDAKRCEQIRQGGWGNCKKEWLRGRSHGTRNARAKLAETQEELIVE
jgi:hypothetical protein